MRWGGYRRRYLDHSKEEGKTEYQLVLSGMMGMSGILLIYTAMIVPVQVTPISLGRDDTFKHAMVDEVISDLTPSPI